MVVPTIGAAYRPSALMPVKPLSACRTASGGLSGAVCGRALVMRGWPAAEASRKPLPQPYIIESTTALDCLASGAAAPPAAAEGGRLRTPGPRELCGRAAAFRRGG